MHWAPVHSFCDVCGLFNFTAVVKLETFDRDQKFVLRSAGLRFKGDGGPSGDGVDELILKLRHVNEAIASRKSGETLAAEYMRQLGPEQVRETLKSRSTVSVMFGRFRSRGCVSSTD